MATEEEREVIVRDAIRFLAGERDEGAENAHNSVDTGDAVETMWLIAEIARRSSGVTDPINIGIGLLDAAIWRYAAAHPEEVADAIVGSTRLIQALPYVRGLSRYPELMARLPVGLTGDT